MISWRLRAISNALFAGLPAIFNPLKSANLLPQRLDLQSSHEQCRTDYAATAAWGDAPRVLDHIRPYLRVTRCSRQRPQASSSVPIMRQLDRPGSRNRPPLPSFAEQPCRRPPASTSAVIFRTVRLSPVQRGSGAVVDRSRQQQPGPLKASSYAHEMERHAAHARRNGNTFARTSAVLQLDNLPQISSAAAKKRRRRQATCIARVPFMASPTVWWLLLRVCLSMAGAALPATSDMAARPQRPYLRWPGSGYLPQAQHDSGWMPCTAGNFAQPEHAGLPH